MADVGDDVLSTLRRGATASFASNVLNTLANAALIVLLARFLLTPTEYGLLNYALSVLAVLSILGTLGLPKSAARYANEYSKTDESQLPHVLAVGAKAVLVMVVLVGVALLLVHRPLAALLGHQEALIPFLLVGAAYVGFRAGVKFVVANFQGVNRVDWSAVTNAVNNVSRVVFASVFVLLGFGAFGAFLGYVVGFGVALLVGGGLLYWRVYRPVDPAPEMEEGLTRRLLEYAVPLTATRGANVLDKKVDVVLVGSLASLTAVSYYTIAKQLSDFISMPATSFGFALSPILGEQSATEDVARAARLYEESLTYVLLVYVPACLGLVLVASPTVVYVFGEKYAPAVPVVQVFSGFILVNAVNKITSDALDYLGRARARATVKSAMAVSNAGLNVLLIPVFGAVGAAAATVVTYTVYTGTNVYVIHSELGLRVRQMARRLAVVCAIATGMGLVVVLALPIVSGLLTLFLVVGVGAAVWAVLGVGTGLLDVEQIRTMVR
ncbi:oligosaccharide flippase family protein [Haloarchaeobius sp. HRN-SO-5]|uniref:oligosaccharide flippase family protein n=1 Tax=Haloarchaeobius sp. HRN-SO-5 TaxID=3446118 RepID=UPI003EBC806B